MSPSPRRSRPSSDELAAARGRTVPDVVGAGPAVLFCGINPGLYSAWSGHHFARPGNRFWPALHRSGFTPRQLAPEEEGELPGLGLGITNIAARATARADELTGDELRGGAADLAERVARYRPGVLAVLGVGAYRTAFGVRGAAVGPQPERIGGAPVWLLPNPSGLNAHWTPAALAGAFAELRAQSGSAAAGTP